jgi:hypothetical protein
MSVLASYVLAFAYATEEKYGKTSVRVEKNFSQGTGKPQSG